MNLCIAWFTAVLISWNGSVIISRFLWKRGNHPHKVTPCASSAKISISWQGVNIPWPRPNESREFVDRKIAPVWLSCAGREKAWNGGWRKKPDVEGIGVFFWTPPSSSAARNLETRLRTNREYPRGAHPESLNHPILISRTVRRAYPTYPLPRNASVHLAIFLARWWIKREDEFVLFVIWRLLNTHWSTVGTLYIIKSHYSLSLYFIRGAYPSRKNSM